MLGVRAFCLAASTHPDQGLLAIRILSEKEPFTTFNQPFERYCAIPSPTQYEVIQVFPGATGGSNQRLFLLCYFFHY